MMCVVFQNFQIFEIAIGCSYEQQDAKVCCKANRPIAILQKTSWQKVDNNWKDEPAGTCVRSLVLYVLSIDALEFYRAVGLFIECVVFLRDTFEYMARKGYTQESIKLWVPYSEWVWSLIWLEVLCCWHIGNFVSARHHTWNRFPTHL